MKKKTTEEFILDAKKVHGDKYDYKLVNYKSHKDKITVICKVHGSYTIGPSHHLNVSGCQLCAWGSKDSSIFIDQCNKRHNNKYDYSLIEYKNNRSKIKIICPEHGIFIQNAKTHLGGSGCRKCVGMKLEEFISRSNKIHNNKYDYSLLAENYSLYNKIICPEHGIFIQSRSNHLSGSNCPNCSNKNKNKYTTESFINKSKETHGDVFIYEKSIFRNIKIPIIITCKNHGDFSQIPNDHLNGSGCPNCLLSKGEELIIKYLKLNSVNYLHQHKFEDCKNKRKLPFDFYLPNINLCIEFDGKQHYIPNLHFGGKDGFEKTKINDNIKDRYCKKEGITLLRIRYDQNIEESLNKVLCRI